MQANGHYTRGACFILRGLRHGELLGAGMMNPMRKSRAVGWIRRLLWLAGVVAGAALVVSAIFAFLFTSPQRRAVREAAREEIGFPVEDVQFRASDGVLLCGWFVPCEESRRGVVLLHGNGSTRAQMVARGRLLRSRGYAVLLYDARGHGESDGELVSVGLLEVRDLRAAWELLRARGVGEIGCLGVSQGGATIALAAPLPPDLRWVVLESVYPDIATALDRRFRRTLHLPGWLAGAALLPIAEWRLGVKARDIAPVHGVAQIKCPLFIMSGERDEHTTPADTGKLFAAAQEPKALWLVPGAAHVDLYGAAGVEYERRLLAFVEER